MSTPNVTGGLFWHWQAWRSQAKWKPTVDLLEAWLQLQTKEKSSDSLVIIGASAGWMMPTDWLCQFKEVHTFDKTPWPRLCFVGGMVKIYAAAARL